MAEVVAVCISENKGERKKPVDCVMPKEGIFAKVITQGSIRPGDLIEQVAAQICIEWRHYDKEGLTCNRCSGTGANLATVVAEYTQRGVAIELCEILLPFERISESNLVLLNGVPLEELLADSSVGESECVSCGCLAGQETCCRTVQYDGEVYEELSPELIRKGIDLVLLKNLA